jgi:hypothetical protein
MENQNTIKKIEDRLIQLDKQTAIYIMINCIIKDKTNNRDRPVYNEYKINHNDMGSVTIKRNLEYAFKIEHRTSYGSKIVLFVPSWYMYTLLEAINYIKYKWLDLSDSEAFVNYRGVFVLKNPNNIIRKEIDFPQDMKLTFDPIISSGSIQIPMLRYHITNMELPIEIHPDRLLCVLHYLERMDVLGYVNNVYNFVYTKSYDAMNRKELVNNSYSNDERDYTLDEVKEKKSLVKRDLFKNQNII